MGSDLLGYKYCECPMGSHNIWKSPYYNFVIRSKKNKKQLKRIVFDVTKSAPHFLETRTVLSEVLDEVIGEIPKDGTIIDFGAGKLRNTIYLMRKGYNVIAVEFDIKTNQSEILTKHANRFKTKFKQSIFPHDFINDQTKVDLIILINVTTVMPVPAERLLVLKYCRSRLKKNGFIFWFTQHGDKHMYDGVDMVEQKIGDGHYKNKKSAFQTFHHEYTNEEIDYMFLANGLRLEESYNANGSQARLYKHKGANPLDSVINPDKINEFIDSEFKNKVKDKKSGIEIVNKSKEIMPIVDELRIENLLIDALDKLPSGKATEYHNLVAAIFLVLFGSTLKNIQIERTLKDNQHRIDIMLSNRAKQGFWSELIANHKSKFILVDCKNYSDKIPSEEFDKFIVGLQGYGKFGIITYRKPINKTDRKRIETICKNHSTSPSPHHIICLNDSDLKEMLNLKLVGDSVDDFLRDRLDTLE